MVSGARTSALDLASLHDEVLRWYAVSSRDLPWREPSCSPWGVLLSEVMSQQTPLARVEPIWREWMARWPTPADLARESPGEVVRAWGRLGYPRRALRLHEAATVIAQRHDGEVPRDQTELRALPGIGDYTAAAVAAFAFGDRSVVVDTNVRRVQARLVTGLAQASPAMTRAEVALAEDLLPDDDEDAATWNVAVMELGALVCTARAPRCEECPVSARCAWVLGGRPAYDGPPRRGQKWHGTDRQVRGIIVQALRESTEPVRREALAPGRDEVQVDRCLAGLVEDGLVEPVGAEHYALPGREEAAG
ncbi:A/G-specific adenine glycosylase [Knoellia locipacati]|uniref:Adenine DNA glycosylase n=1 Tax=Knoellia locipacati TaxID=882824 RepID=A0A512SYY6_9MICO|nr:A/G-specific adenine glycosylase [Knoellia locipacati]GEQ13167.1 adenine glycosylase [Knoellia locipacati]